MESLPPEIWSMIFRFLDPFDICKTCRVCKTWFLLASFYPNVARAMLKNKWSIYKVAGYFGRDDLVGGMNTSNSTEFIHGAARGGHLNIVKKYENVATFHWFDLHASAAEYGRIKILKYCETKANPFWAMSAWRAISHNHLHIIKHCADHIDSHVEWEFILSLANNSGYTRIIDYCKIRLSKYI